MDTVPTGYRFVPTDREIIEDYLIKVDSHSRIEDLPSRAVVKKVIYGKDLSLTPWDNFSMNDPLWVPVGDIEDSSKKKKKTIYVYTQVNYVNSSRRNHVNRRSGRGSWSGKSKVTKITKSRNGKKELIGYKKKFTYLPDADLGDRKCLMKKYGKWLMHEYSLAGVYKPKSDYVVCKITNAAGSIIQEDVYDGLELEEKEVELMKLGIDEQNINIDDAPAATLEECNCQGCDIMLDSFVQPPAPPMMMMSFSCSDLFSSSMQDDYEDGLRLLLTDTIPISALRYECVQPQKTFLQDSVSCQDSVKVMKLGIGEPAAAIEESKCQDCDVYHMLDSFVQPPSPNMMVSFSCSDTLTRQDDYDDGLRLLTDSGLQDSVIWNNESEASLMYGESHYFADYECGSDYLELESLW